MCRLSGGGSCCQTNNKGLIACCEFACTWLHGANRLSSNSLLESIIFAHRSYLKIKEIFPEFRHDETAIPAWDPRGATQSDESIVVTNNWDEIRRSMSNYVGIVRSDKRLERAKRRIDLIQQEIDDYYRNFIITRDLLELRNNAYVAK